jgi:hypothetical protein
MPESSALDVSLLRKVNFEKTATGSSTFFSAAGFFLAYATPPACITPSSRADGTMVCVRASEVWDNRLQIPNRRPMESSLG